MALFDRNKGAAAAAQEVWTAHHSVLALTELNLRYGAIVLMLLEGVGEVLDDVDGDVRVRLETAAADAGAQLIAAVDALDAATIDLPEAARV